MGGQGKGGLDTKRFLFFHRIVLTLFILRLCMCWNRSGNRSRSRSRHRNRSGRVGVLQGGRGGHIIVGCATDVRVGKARRSGQMVMVYYLISEVVDVCVVS